jgi:hypothetical protein
MFIMDAKRETPHPHRHLLCMLALPEHAAAFPANPALNQRAYYAGKAFLNRV